LLRKRETHKASRYAIKNAIMELGPTGFPFERLVAELLKHQGFSVEVDKIIQGWCVSHEIDVIAQKDKRLVIVESKFHNQQGIRTDVKVALYVQARFEDLRKQLLGQFDREHKLLEAWLVTNTKLTSDAIQYANCVGIRAIGWSYPQDNSLQNLIEQANLHPLTSLTTLSKYQKRQLLGQGLVLCQEIDTGVLQSIGISKPKAIKVLKEANVLCKKHDFH
jgi:Holliday junction resolvase-like predicted endonuclease